MNAKNFNRQVFVVEDDNPIDDYSRKRSQEEFLPRKSKSFSRDFPSFKESVSSGASFIKTPKGLAIVITIILIGGLILAGGIAGLVYYLGYSLNATTYTIAPNTTTTTPASIIDSIILTTQEKNNLIALGGFKSFVLCFRGSRDGFYVNVFHRLCDNKIQTVSIIRSHLNSVFGGYTAQTWNAINTYKSDSTAWIFSLRRRGVTNSERFNVTISGWAMYAHTNFGPTFGGGHDIYICENSDISQCSTSGYCHSYQCPVSYTTGNMYLAGAQTFNTTEIEVYQVAF